MWVGSDLRFFCDRMLGKLAKKLRLLGFDVLYFSELDEKEILKLSERRILLTRDKILYRWAIKRGIRVFYIKSDRWRSQLKAVASIFPLEKYAKPFTRCSVCNGILVSVAKEEVQGKVPEYVFKTVEEFKVCEDCGRIYWKGSHIDWIVEDVGKLVRVWKEA